MPPVLAPGLGAVSAPTFLALDSPFPWTEADPCAPWSFSFSFPNFSSRRHSGRHVPWAAPVALALRVVGTAVTLGTHLHGLLRRGGSLLQARPFCPRKATAGPPLGGHSASALRLDLGHRAGWPLPRSSQVFSRAGRGAPDPRTCPSELTPLKEPRDPTDDSSRGAVRLARCRSIIQKTRARLGRWPWPWGG